MNTTTIPQCEFEERMNDPGASSEVSNGVCFANILVFDPRVKVLNHIMNNKVINRVVPSAIKNRSNRNSYQNPGGDTLWPATEGTVFGYEYTISLK